MALNRKLQNKTKNYFLNGFFSISSVILTDTILTVWNFRVFSIQIYLLYAYHIFWGREAGRLIWACFSSKILNAAPYSRLSSLHHCFGNTIWMFWCWFWHSMKWQLKSVILLKRYSLYTEWTKYLEHLPNGGSRVAQRSKTLHLHARGITTDPGLIQGCITTGHDRESNRAAHNWPSVIRVWPG
jgi:hypothetical protein